MNIHGISLSKVNRKLIMNKEEQTSRQVFSLCFWCCCFFYALKLIRSVGKAIGSRLYFEEPNKKTKWSELNCVDANGRMCRWWLVIDVVCCMKWKTMNTYQRNEKMRMISRKIYAILRSYIVYTAINYYYYSCDSSCCRHLHQCNYFISALQCSVHIVLNDCR